jgi:Protein of unknown function (DUF4025)
MAGQRSDQNATSKDQAQPFTQVEEDQAQATTQEQISDVYNMGTIDQAQEESNR